jgi:hypothetical protein
LLAFAGLAEPPVHQGLSLVDLARGKSARIDRDAVLIEQNDGLRGLRAEKWSLVPLGATRLLFNQVADPAQQNPLLPSDAAPAYRHLTELLAEQEAAADLLRERYRAEATEVRMDADERERLKNIGYTGD